MFSQSQINYEGRDDQFFQEPAQGKAPDPAKLGLGAVSGSTDTNLKLFKSHRKAIETNQKNTKNQQVEGILKRPFTSQTDLLPVLALVQQQLYLRPRVDP